MPGLVPGQLIEIRKGVFGLATSPKLWWLKLSSDMLELKIHYNGEDYFMEQNEIDPCAFRLKNGKGEVHGMIFTHVDDLMVMAPKGLLEELKATIKNKFLVDDWEQDKFEYIGCEYEVSADELKITQTGYVESRLEKVAISPGLGDEEDATPEMIEQNRAAIGYLSWLAKQTRPDIQFQVA